MSIIHISVGEKASLKIKEALNAEEHAKDTFIALNDFISLGPLQKQEGSSFSEMREKYWHILNNNVDNEGVKIEDIENILKASTELNKNPNTQIWFWMAANSNDICAYFCLLHYLNKHSGKIAVININGLPFLNDEGKLFYPSDLSELPSKEIIKAQKLARIISPSEWETDCIEWQRLTNENSAIRLFKGGKKISSAEINYFDDAIFNLIQPQIQKINRVVTNAINKSKLPLNETFILSRLKALAEEQKIALNNNEVKLLSMLQPEVHNASTTNIE